MAAPHVDLGATQRPQVTLGLDPSNPINGKHDAGQAASTVFQVFGVTRPGQIELTLPDLVARAHETVSLSHYCIKLLHRIK